MRRLFLAILFLTVYSIGWPSAFAQENQDPDQESIVLSFWQVVTNVVAIVVSVVFTIGFYAWTQRKEKEKREKETRSALREELDKHKKDLDSNLQDYMQEYVSSTGTNEKFVNRFFPTTAYDSVVHSGVITSYDKDEQYELSEIYWRFKMHNEVLLRLYDFYNTFFMDDVSEKRQRQWQSRALPMFELLNNWENELKTSIGAVLGKL
jgi:hypothetical protein